MCPPLALLFTSGTNARTNDTIYDIRIAGKSNESSNSVDYLHELFPVRQQYRFVRQNH